MMKKIASGLLLLTLALSINARTGIVRLIQKLLRRHQIGGAETLRKAVVDWLEAGDGID